MKFHLKKQNSDDNSHTATRQEGHQERPDELISIDSNDLHGRPQGAQGADLPLDTFPAFRPYTPRMKYLPGGPHLPQISTGILVPEKKDKND